MKKKVYFAILLLMLISMVSCIGFVYAINVEVSMRVISDSYILELNEPAVFDIIIFNRGQTDSFEIFSVVGIDIFPKTPVTIPAGESETIRISASPQEALKKNRGFSTYEYVIKNSQNEVQKERLSINIAGLEDAFLVTPENINPKSDKIKLSIKNTLMYEFNDVQIDMSSAFFQYSQKLSFKPLELKEIEIDLDKEKLKTLTAGQYLIKTEINTLGKSAGSETIFKFLEEENIESSDSSEGILIKRTEFSRNNIGNVKKRITISIQKNLLSALFTSTNPSPTSTQINGFKKTYNWEKDLYPNEQLKIVAKTNWLYPIFIIVLIVLVVIFIRRYVETDLMIKKKINYVRTKGGEFALKVQLKVKARRYVERIKVDDRIPHLVSLYDKFGAVTPDKIDSTNRRLEWNVDSLNPGEERIFSYIVYSKIGVVGKFELPAAKAIYEREGKIKSSVSNRSFFVNEPGHSRM